MPRHSEATKSAIKNRTDIVALVGEYLPLRRVGTKYKALCQWHDDHSPSLEVNSERQSFKCWVCGVGGDVFDFVMKIERVEFPEALRMLADRAGVTLESPPPNAKASSSGPTKSELYEVNAWAEEVFAEALVFAEGAQGYLDHRGLSRQSIERFRLGYAPIERGWFLAQARRKGFRIDLLVAAGLASEVPDSPGSVRERFRGRLIFPIHDDRSRAIGFGGRILPDVEQKLASQGKQVAKYLNSPETLLFHKRTLVYAGDLAKTASREAGWVAVVEGYTDVIAAHQVGLSNVVGTLGTALGEDHLRALKRLADRVVLVYDADPAGAKRRGSRLEFFLGSDLDLRVLTLPATLDPCDYLLQEGGEAFRALVERAADPLAYLVTRAAERFDLNLEEGSRRAAEWILGLMSHVPTTHHQGVEFKQAKAVDRLSHLLHMPVETLNRLRQRIRRPAAKPGGGVLSADANGVVPQTTEIRQSELDRTDLDLIQIVLRDPESVTSLLGRLSPNTLKDAPLREILQVCFDLQGDGEIPNYANLMVRLDDPAVRSLAASLIDDSALSTPDPGKFPDSIDFRPAPWRERLEKILVVLEAREQKPRVNELKRWLEENDKDANPDVYSAIQLEYLRLVSNGRSRKNSRVKLCRFVRGEDFGWTSWTKGSKRFSIWANVVVS